MAITFSDLHTESGLKSLDEFLSGKSYVSGDNLTKVYAAVLVKPGDSFPNVCKRYDAVSSQLAARFVVVVSCWSESRWQRCPSCGNADFDSEDPNLMIEYDAPTQLVKPRERNTRFGWSKWTLACISTMTFSDLVNIFSTGLFSIIDG